MGYVYMLLLALLCFSCDRREEEAPDDLDRMVMAESQEENWDLDQAVGQKTRAGEESTTKQELVIVERDGGGEILQR